MKRGFERRVLDAAAVLRLYQEHGLTIKAISDRFGVSQTRISDLLKTSGVAVERARRDSVTASAPI